MLRTFLMGFLAAAMILTSGGMAVARTAPDGQTMVICTGMGVETVTLDANGEPIDAPPICPDCVIHAVGVLENGPRVSGPANKLTLLHPTPAAQLTLSFEAVQAAARGPPAGA
ncbi:hypothetical protein [uncultured Litoreibacter sp.]|uniref:hypothetical protein n=1 Tax=uncultured Litoreibacter sp. TaxID=1392394 RepID=UPI00260D45FF|nr:hypothetical protein [uncultured Litoreibacter sp.]